MPSRNKLPAYAAAVVTLLALGALAGTAVTPAAAQNLTTIRFGDQTGSEVDYAAVWVADMNGYYKDEGIQLERKTYANGPATLLDLNNLDAATAAIVPYMLFAARGGEVTMVMSTTKGNAPIVGKKQYTSVKELAGKNVGTPGIGTIHDAVLGYIEETQGFKVNHVPAKISDVAVMIEKGEVEAFIGWEPASAAATAQAPEPPLHPAAAANSQCGKSRTRVPARLHQGASRKRREVHSRDAQRHRLDPGKRLRENGGAASEENERSELL